MILGNIQLCDYVHYVLNNVMLVGNRFHFISLPSALLCILRVELVIEEPLAIPPYVRFCVLCGSNYSEPSELT